MGSLGSQARHYDCPATDSYVSGNLLGILAGKPRSFMQFPVTHVWRDRQTLQT